MTLNKQVVIGVIISAVISNASWLYFAYGKNQREKAAVYVEISRQEGSTFAAVSIPENELTGLDVQDRQIIRQKLSPNSRWEYIATIWTEHLNIPGLPPKYKKIFVFKETAELVQ